MDYARNDDKPFELDPDRVTDFRSHAGNWRDRLRRYRATAVRAVSEGPTAVAALVDTMSELVAEPWMLFAAWQYLQRHGGQAPGPDGLRYRDLDTHDVWRLLNAVSRAIRTSRYRPGPVKVVKVKKSSGSGTRPLVLSNIIDRVVQRAVVEVVQPVLDPTFSKMSFGFRPGRGRLEALAAAEAHFRAGRSVWAADDLADAFTSIPLGRLFQQVASRLGNTDIADFIEFVAGGRGKAGVPQGGPLSPLLLNVYLDAFLDRRWPEVAAGVPLLRVADDLMLACRTRKEAARARGSLADVLLPTGMKLRPEKSELAAMRRGEVIHWLGFRIAANRSGLRVRPGARVWVRLDRAFREAHARG